MYLSFVCVCVCMCVCVCVYFSMHMCTLMHENVSVLACMYVVHLCLYVQRQCSHVLLFHSLLCMSV